MNNVGNLLIISFDGQKTTIPHLNKMKNEVIIVIKQLNLSRENKSTCKS